MRTKRKSRVESTMTGGWCRFGVRGMTTGGACCMGWGLAWPGLEQHSPDPQTLKPLFRGGGGLRGEGINMVRL